MDVSIPQTWTGRSALMESDPELKALIQKEKARQVLGLELIASEVSHWMLTQGWALFLVAAVSVSLFLWYMYMALGRGRESEQ